MHSINSFMRTLGVVASILFLQVGIHPAQAVVGVDVSTSCSVSGSLIRVSTVVFNASDTATLAIGVIDDAGTPGSSGDDFGLTGPGTLAPGATGTYNGAFTPPGCGQFPNTVTVFSTNVSLIVSQAVSTCGYQPALAVGKTCDVVSNGTLISFIGTVTNTGNVALNFVTAIEDHGTPGNPNDDTLEFGPVTLLPGNGALFGGNYVTGNGLHTNTIRAVGYFGPGITNWPLRILRWVSRFKSAGPPIGKPV